MKTTHSLPLASVALLFFTAAAELAGCGDDAVTVVTSATSTTATATTTSTGGNGGGGTGGGGAPPNTGTDQCPGDPYTLASNTLLTLHGDTSTATGDYQSLCGEEAGSGPDLVYAFTLTDAGTLSLNYTSLMTGFDPVMYLRTDCVDDATVIWCRDFSNTERQDKRHIDAGTYYLIVDGAAASSGPYELLVDFRAPSCGDGAVNPGEDCDDGNMVPGDGCDLCMLEPGAFESCADTEVVTIDPGHTVLSGTTLGNVHDHTFNEADCTIGGVAPGPTDTGAPDRLYELTASVSGTMTMTLGFDQAGTTPICEVSLTDPGCWDRVLHVRHVDMALGQAICEDVEDISNPTPANWIPPSAMTQIACDGYGTMANGYTQTVSFPVTAGEVYYVFIDGFYQSQYSSGPYYLHIDLN